MMISSKQRRNDPPRQISCALTSSSLDDERLEPHGSHQLIDYRTFRASVDESCGYRIRRTLRSASQHEKRLTFLKERQEQLLATRQAAAAANQQQESVRSSMVDLVPPSSSTKACVSCDSSEDEDDDESEVLFALKVSKPSRLIRRRRSTFQASNNSSRASSSMNRLSCSATIFDHSMSLQFVAAAVSATIPIAPSKDYGGGSSSNGDLSNQTCPPNHDSFQSSSAEFPVVVSSVGKPASDPRKKRKSMMNWLANRLSTRELMAPPSKDPSPPTFVKVIYLNDRNMQYQDHEAALQEKHDTCSSSISNAKLEGMGSEHSRYHLDDSHHRKISSPMA